MSPAGRGEFRGHHSQFRELNKVSPELETVGLCLPSGTAMTTKDLDRVISVIRDCQKKR